MASIARNGMKYQWDGAHNHMYFPERFSLAINGGNYDLFPASVGAHCGRYYAKDAPQLHITRYNDSPSCIGVPGTTTNSTHEYWIVKTGNGTIYRFGYNFESEQVVTQNAAFARAEGYTGALCVNGASDCWGGASRWRVDRVTDVYNNVMTFSYQVTSSTETPDDMGQPITTEHTRVKLIDYNGSLSRVEFTNSSNASYNWIDRIRVYNNTNTNKIREYRLTADGAFHRLLSITPYDGGSLALPATTFTHTDLNHDTNLPFPYIRRIDNGYGGATEFSYDWDGRKEKSGTLFYGYSYRVIETRTYDGLNPTAARRQYTYSGPCYDQWQLTWNPGLQLCKSAYAPEYGPLVGYASVTETTLNYDGMTASISAHRFYTDVQTVNSPRRGREYWTQSLDAANAPFAQTDTTYTSVSNGSTTFTAVSQANETTYASGTSLMKRTTYAYDGYGHVSQQREYAKADDATPYRTTTTDYVVNGALWIVDTPLLVRIYAGDSTTGTELKRVGYYYDRDASGNLRAWGAAPLRGEMVFEDVYGYQPAAHTWTYNWYDGYGNLSATVDARGNTTYTYYDPTYHSYPTQIVNAKTHPTNLTYNLALGLVTQVTDPNNAVTQYQYDTFGRLRKVAKPYDTLTIPTIEYFYADGYNVNGLKGLKVQENYREVSGNAAAYRPIIKLYDGLGRLVQERAETIDGSQQSVSNVTYDARGLTRYAYIPAAESFSWDFVRPTGWDTRPKTTNDYDAAGRPFTVIAPDNTRTNYRYEIATDNGVTYLLDNTIDANRHRKQYRRDTFGRLAKVLELTGDCSQWGTWGFTCAAPYTTQWAPYATTQYTYDVLGNLTRVQDQAGNSTSMTYCCEPRSLTVIRAIPSE